MVTRATRTPSKTTPTRKPAVAKVAAKVTPEKSVTKVSAPSMAIKPPKKHKKEKKDSGKLKVVRDSFTMPQNDYELIASLKQKALSDGMHVKKSELLRAGLRLLATASPAQLKKSLTDLEIIKTGRPKKN
jgi:hypothetical protein